MCDADDEKEHVKKIKFTNYKNEYKKEKQTMTEKQSKIETKGKSIIILLIILKIMISFFTILELISLFSL